MSRDITEALIRNLKLFNAKERDHLMRFAYLGESGLYDGSPKFLSLAFHGALEEHLVGMGISGSAECVFAGMDYHLDWLFAALWMARRHPDWTGEPNNAPAPVPMAAIDRAAIPAVTGSQEDIDLLVVYRADNGALAMIVIEAKGSASFDGVQLARKLIRLDRILDESGMPSGAQGVTARFLLASPPRENSPQFASCREYAKGLLTPRTKGRDALLAALEDNRSGIGEGFHHLELQGFPERLYAVNRTRIGAVQQTGAAPEPEPYTHWKLAKRRR